MSRGRALVQVEPGLFGRVTQPLSRSGLLWRPVFRQERSFQRALRQVVGALLVIGSATLTRILASLGLDQQGWSADYKLNVR